ncbi:MAG: hypothetical protein ACLFSQ_09095 [Candidatus Zixiibacteriota bacterium]
MEATKLKSNKTHTGSFPKLFVGDINIPSHEIGDTERKAVEKALYLKATGYTIVEKKTEYGKNEKVVETEKHHAPDLSAIKYLLGNRFPDRWQDKPDIENDENRDFRVVFGEYDKDGNLIIPRNIDKPKHE